MNQSFIAVQTLSESNEITSILSKVIPMTLSPEEEKTFSKREKAIYLPIEWNYKGDGTKPQPVSTTILVCHSPTT